MRLANCATAFNLKMFRINLHTKAEIPAFWERALLMLLSSPPCILLLMAITSLNLISSSPCICVLWTLARY